MYVDKDSRDNTFYRNNLVRCKDYASDLGTDNRFDDSVGIGNHWGDYIERFVPEAVQNGTRWSMPYVIDAVSGSRDDYPNVHRFGYQPMDVDFVFDPQPPLAVPTTGDPFTLGCWPHNHTEVGRVMIRLWQAYELLTNPYVETDEDWRYHFVVPDDSLEPLGFLFIVEDIDGNRTYSSIGTIDVVDNDSPTIQQLSAPQYVDVLQKISIDMVILDNIDVKDVWVEHWYEDGEHTNTSASEGRDGHWTFEIDAPGVPTVMNYMVHASDADQNRVHSLILEVWVYDNTLPWFGRDLSDQNATTGDPFRFKVEAFDNSGLAEVVVAYSIGDAYHVNTSLDENSGYALIITIPEGTIELMQYRYRAEDLAGDQNHTP